MLISSDILSISLAIFLSMVIRYGDINKTLHNDDYLSYLITLLFSVIVFLRIGLYRSIVRFMGQKAFLTVLKAVSISSLILAASIMLTRNGMPRSIPFIYWGIALFFIGGSRFIVWFHYQALMKKDKENVAIYGAGGAGRQLLTSLNHGDKYEVKFFIDDDRDIKGRVIDGVKVYRPHHIEELIKTENITQLLLAIPSVSGSRRRKVIQGLEQYPVQVMTIPGMVDIVNGKAKIEELLEIEIDDLLGRDSVSPNNELFDKCIKNKVVFVSGAGGSIGSELCRQIIKHKPRHLIIFELSEYALYSIEQELKKLIPNTILLTSLLGSIQDKKRLQSIFTAYGVNTIYHAAAYKHVPIVEENIVAGIRNNIFGTRWAAEAACASSVETFVLISTDKAVRPTNIMGTTKRFAEMVLQGLAEKTEGNCTRFCMVRFGNVLGSSGSVVPLFKKQIKQGGPVTVTHPDITRYFMTIPEAAQLVLQAGSLGQGGDVFVLDMGESVKIAELARKMIHLSGYDVKDESRPDGDIEIVYSGLRPGEKLYEELLIGDNVTGTQHPRIMRAEEKKLPMAVIDEKMALLDEACNDFNVSWVREILMDSETGYVPDKEQPVDLLWCELKKKENNVVSISKLGDS
ncbi:MAG: polysaccharide biosynthesis protein [Gammaproteobacteria bacterium]|nr:polysaccharide biosynthesis protein [Gammaproteobacteria bacterium]